MMHCRCLPVGSLSFIRNMFRKCAFLLNRKPGRSLLVIMVILIVVVKYMTLDTENTDPRETVVTNSNQQQLDYIAANLKVKVAVLGSGDVAFKLHNSGSTDIVYGDWRIYFFTFNRLPSQFPAPGLLLLREGGGLHFISPSNEFTGIPAKQSVKALLHEFNSISKSDHFPNWYVTSSANDTRPRLLLSTLVDDASFVEDFATSEQWKRGLEDNYNPYSLEQRYNLNSYMHQAAANALDPKIAIVPTPSEMKIVSSKYVPLDYKWRVVAPPELFNVSKMLADELHLPIYHAGTSKETASGHVILFKLGEKYSTEEYQIHVSSVSNNVTVTSQSAAGAFYAIKSLKSLMQKDNTIPEVVIRDKPRFGFRGLMVDVARNFVPKTTILKLIDSMARHKLNVLHLHLTDDEGWRIEITDIPELTSIAGRRCHNHEREGCMQSSLGSGPYSNTSGSGFYTIEDFKEILKYAKERFVKVIPEIDVPGHSRAAIIAMKFRENIILRRSEEGGNSDPSYILTDSDTNSESVQGWGGNSINPCMNATYRFLDTVIQSLVETYRGIHDLDVIHLGGDEVPLDAWSTSPACQRVLEDKPYDHRTLVKMFMVAAADIAYTHNLSIATWEDGMYEKGDMPYSRDLFKHKNVYVNAWNNIWEAGFGGRAIEFANAGYNTVLSMATHLYFDHPYEPDPEERGLYWATRYVDTYKVFGFMPNDIFANADFDRNGNKLDRETLCNQQSCHQLNKPENIIGMSACIWSETVRNEDQLFYMLYPRIIAYAERAWHKDSWESITDKNAREIAKLNSWGTFLNILGTQELPRLDSIGIPYRIPPPGVHIDTSTDQVSANTMYPGYIVQESRDNGRTWHNLANDSPVSLGAGSAIFRTASPSFKHFSRTVSPLPNSQTLISSSAQSSISKVSIVSMLFPMFVILNILYASTCT